jgi:hypothetical protein
MQISHKDSTLWDKCSLFKEQVLWQKTVAVQEMAAQHQEAVREEQVSSLQNLAETNLVQQVIYQELEEEIFRQRNNKVLN